MPRAAMILLLTVLTATMVWAGDGEWTSGDCKVTLVSGELTVSGSGRMADYYIPESREWAFEKASIEKIVIGPDVTYIGDNTFCDLPYLTEVDFSGATSLHRIGMYSFAHNTGLNSIELPEKLDTIGQHTFEECTELKHIGIPASVTGIGNHAFRNCSSLTSVTIPAATTRILNYTFSGCTKLATVSFAEGSKLDVIAEYAFENTGLTSIDIPASLTNIGIEAFVNCPALAAINIAPENTSYTSIEGVVFYMDNTYLYIYPAGKPDTNYEIPSTVEVVCTSAFKGCTKLTSVTFPDGFTAIASEGFAGCTGLTSVTFPSSLTGIGELAFANCSNLATVTLNSNPRFDRPNIFDGIKEDAIVKMNLPGMKVGDDDWLDFHCCAYSFEAEDDTKIFKGKLTDNGVLLTELTADKIVPGNNGVLLKKTTSSNFVLELTSATSGNDFSYNSLIGENYPVSGFGNYYMFDNRAEGFGFFKITPNQCIEVGHVYFTYTPTGEDPAPEWFTLSDTATGIDVLRTDAQSGKHAAFDLQGRRHSVSPSRKAVIVSGGRKFFAR